MSHLTTVAIVGGGPCGLLAALLLARSGVDCVLLEKNAGISTHPKAMGISRRTAEIYRQVGLYAPLASVSLPLEGKDLAIWSRKLLGEELGRTPLTDFHSPLTPVTAQHCPQTETERILLDALRNEPRAEVRFGVEVTGLTLQEEGGDLHLANGEHLAFRWLIGADGAGSRVRQWLEIGTTGPGDMGHFLNVMFRAPLGDRLAGREALLYNVFWEEGYEFFVSINGHDLWLMHHFLQPGETQADYPPERILGLIAEAVGWPEIPAEILGLSHWVMSPKLAKDFRRGPAFLVGDAAARLSPAGGLGLNTGLQSVHNLAWKLAAVVHGQAGERLLDTYQEERNAISATVMRSTNQNSGEIFATVAAAVGGRWHEVRTLIQHNRRGGSNLGLDLGMTYERGAFCPDGTTPPAVADPLNDYLPTAHPGRRAPHLPVVVQGVEKSILDLWRGFVLATPSGGESWDLAAVGENVRLLVEGRDFQGPGFAGVYGLQPGGAVLIRPDGIVGARWTAPPEDPVAELRAAMDRILARPG
jgi:putative polyketide hydroxylase